MASRFARAGVTLRAIPASGASFAEAVGRGMEAALETPATHLCILRAGRYVPPAGSHDLSGPGNLSWAPSATKFGNAQFVPIDSTILPTQANWVDVENFANAWRKSFGQTVVPTPTLGLGCLLLHRGVVACSGPLDERVGKDAALRKWRTLISRSDEMLSIDSVDVFPWLSRPGIAVGIPMSRRRKSLRSFITSNTAVKKGAIRAACSRHAGIWSKIRRWRRAGRTRCSIFCEREWRKAGPRVRRSPRGSMAQHAQPSFLSPPARMLWRA